MTRKLGRNDRILGAAGLCLKHNLPCGKITSIFYSALKFTAADQNGETFKADQTFLKGVEEMGISKALIDLCGLDTVEDDEGLNILGE